MLVYRGSWCPYCNAQLRAFQRAAEALTEVGARVVAVSVDDEPTTAALIAKHRLTFPVGHSADAAAVAAATGAFVDPAGGYLQSTGFVLDPAGRVIVSVYSSGAIGRLVPDDVVGLIRYVRQHAAASWPEGHRHDTVRRPVPSRSCVVVQDGAMIRAGQQVARIRRPGDDRP